MANTCESAIKTVNGERAKVVVPSGKRSGQNGDVGRHVALNEVTSWTASPPVDSRRLPSHVLRRRNVETPYISRRRSDEWARRKAQQASPAPEYTSDRGRSPIDVRAWDVGRSEGRAVMVRIPVETSPGAKASPRPTGLPSRENLFNHWKERMQMTGRFGSWCALRSREGARRPQMSIAKAGAAAMPKPGHPSKVAPREA